MKRREEAKKSALRDLVESEAASGVILIVAALCAVIAANGPAAELYHAIIHHRAGPVLTPRIGPMTVHLWINDGLMALFFLLVGLEIKREFVDGRLSSWDRRRLPMVAAFCGMAVPAIIYLLFAGGDPQLAAGWAIPAATDIAFALGVLALLGSRAPTSLKLFLTTVAIVDDMGAVAIIAVVYTSSLDILALVAAGAILALIYGLGKAGVRALPPFLLLALCLWYAILCSGVHATVAGVLAAAAIPIIKTPGEPDSVHSPLHRLEHLLSRPVAFLIVPLFGFANAGVSLAGLGLDDLVAPLPLGIAAGLFLGKQIGIFGAIRISVTVGLARGLRGATWLQVYGVAMLCGIGFTMSLFIGSLAFIADPARIEEAKIGVLLGSLASALAGFLILRFAPLHPLHDQIEAEQHREIVSDGDLAGVEEAGPASAPRARAGGPAETQA
jgi:NhaA family Na+:H+ antiporter